MVAEAAATVDRPGDRAVVALGRQSVSDRRTDHRPVLGEDAAVGADAAPCAGDEREMPDADGRVGALVRVALVLFDDAVSHAHRPRAVLTLRFAQVLQAETGAFAQLLGGVIDTW